MRILNINDLEAAGQRGLKRLYLSGRARVSVGLGSCGLACGAADVMAAMQNELPEADLIRVGCLGLCEAEPLLDVLLPGRPRIVYGNVSAAKAAELARAIARGSDELVSRDRQQAQTGAGIGKSTRELAGQQ